MSAAADCRAVPAAGGETHLSPPLLPHAELPVLSRAAGEAVFVAPEQVFEAGLEALRRSLEQAVTGQRTGPGLTQRSDTERSPR